MSIGAVVTGGFSTGPFDPGVSLIPTSGFESGEIVNGDPGYICGSITMEPFVKGTLTLTAHNKGTVELNNCQC